MKTMPRRPRLEPLEDRQTPADLLGAVRDPALFSVTALRRGDDISSPLVPLGFAIDLLGSAHTAVHVNTNGNLTFTAPLSAFKPAPLGTLGVDIIAPLFADVDTRNPASGVVLYGTGVIDGHRAFVATWDGVGYYNSRADRVDRFQAVLIDRSDLAPGYFDLELNYAQVQWDEAQGVAGLGARAGLADHGGTSFELPGSGKTGATLDTSDVGLAVTSTGSPTAGRHVFLARGGAIGPNRAPVITPVADHKLLEAQGLTLAVSAIDPDGDPVAYSLDAGGSGATLDPATGTLTLLAAAPGDYTVVVTATDPYGLASSTAFSVHVANVAPVVRAGDDAFLSRGDTLARNVTFVDPGAGPFTATADFADGSGTVPLTRNADGSFALTHTYTAEGNFTVAVTVDDGHDAITGTFTVIVLPDVRRMTVYAVAGLTPGETTTLDLTDPATGRKLQVSVARAADASPDGALFVAFYDDNPTGVPTALGRQAFDVQIRNSDDGDAVTIDYDSGRAVIKARAQYFNDALRNWLDVPATVVATANGLRLEVTDNTIFGGTVFVVGVSTGGTTVTTVARPAVASAGGPGGTTDAGAATASAIQFVSRTQLTLTVSAVQDRQLTSGSAVGNRSGGNRVVTLSSTSGVGGSEEEKPPEDESKVTPAGDDQEEKKKDDKAVKPAVEEENKAKPRPPARAPEASEALPMPREEEREDPEEEQEQEAAGVAWAWALSPLLALPARLRTRNRRE